MVLSLAGATLIAGGLGASANLLGNAMSAKANLKSQQKQYHYNTQMMKNAHQWEVEDLKKAGLNPVLSAGGNGASGSGVGLPQAPDYGTMGNAINSAITNYLDTKRLENEKQISDSTSDLNEANATKARKEAGVIDAKTNQDIKESESRIVKNKAETNEIKSNQELIQAKRIEALNNSGGWGQFLLAKHFGGKAIDVSAKKLKQWQHEHDEKMKNDKEYRKMWEEADLTKGIFGY